METLKILTLGTDRRNEEDFIEILNSYNITALIDVRSNPSSKILVFNQNNLKELLKINGIDYYFFGNELGGFRKGGYEAYALSDSFFAGIRGIENIAAGKLSVIMCAEKLPWKCHRKWIARELLKRGWSVEHIIDKGKVWSPKISL